MFDLYFFWWLAIPSLIIGPFALLQRGFPALLPGSTFILPSFEQIEKRYRQRLQSRWAIRAILVLLGAYYLVRATTAPANVVPSRTVFLSILTGSIMAVLCGFALGIVVRIYRERSLANRLPQFQQDLPPPWIRLAMFIMLAVTLGLVALETSGSLPGDRRLWLSAMFAALIAYRTVMMRVLIARRREVPLDSPMGIRIASMIERFGFQPRRFLLLPSIMANGFALRDGSVIMTTALASMLTEDEIGAILAHELSHARDRDVTRILRFRFLFLFLIVLAILIMFSALFSFDENPYYSLITIFCSMATAPIVFSCCMARVTQPMEYKCDAAAAALGLGPDLVEGLKKLHRYNGLPLEFSAWDRPFLSHPSLELRIEAIGKFDAASTEMT